MDTRAARGRGWARDALQLQELENEDWVPEHTIERMREFYEFRRRFAARLTRQAENSEEDEDPEERSQVFQRFRRELLGAEWAALLQLRNHQGRLSDEVRRRVERDLDLKDARLEI